MIISKKDDGKARRAAKRHGLRIFKARGPENCDNRGGYRMVDERNFIVDGYYFELSPQDVIHYCQTVQPTVDPWGGLGTFQKNLTRFQLTWGKGEETGDVLLNVPDYVLDEDDTYSDEHRIYTEFDDEGIGIGEWTYDDEYEDDNTPLDHWFKDWLTLVKGTGYEVGTFECRE